MIRPRRSTKSKYRRIEPEPKIKDVCTQTDLSQEGLKEIVSQFIKSRNLCTNQSDWTKKDVVECQNGEAAVKLTFDEWVMQFVEDEPESVESNSATIKQTTGAHLLLEPCLDNKTCIKVEVDANFHISSNDDPADSTDDGAADDAEAAGGILTNGIDSDEKDVGGSQKKTQKLHPIARTRRSKRKSKNADEDSDSVTGAPTTLPAHDVEQDTSLSVLLKMICDICGREFRLHTELVKHRKDEHGGCVSKCDVCNKLFSTRSKMEIHRRLHTGARPYRCEQCGRSYREMSSLRKHVLKSKHNCNNAIFKRRKARNLKSTARHIPCEKCGRVLRDLKSLRSHMWLHDGINCKECGRPFKTDQTLQQHMKLKHTEGKPIKHRPTENKPKIVKKRFRKGKIPNSCPICSHTTKHYVRHMLTHLADVPTMCKFCAVILDNDEELQTHLDSHTPDEIQVCDTCGKAFGSRGRLNEHKRIHLRAALDQRPIFKCNVCNMGFLQEDQQKEHMECHVNDTNFRCVQCDETFPTTDKLKAHVLSHTGEKQPINCPLCDLVCPTKNWYSRHKIKKHFKNHMCSVCGKQFSNNVDLNRHTMLHTGNFKHKCEICGKGFIRLAKLNIHMCMHTGEKPFSCEHCGCTFYVEGLLKRHLLQHDGNANFICSECNLSFPDEQKLGRHLREHQKNNSTITCTYCNLAFVDTRYRRNHMRSVHGVKDFVCDVCCEELNCRIDLINHRITVHGPEYIYTCNVCDKKFIKKVNLNVHIRKTHKQGVFSLLSSKVDEDPDGEKSFKAVIKTEKTFSKISKGKKKRLVDVSRPKLCSQCGVNQVENDEVLICDKCKQDDQSTLMDPSDNNTENILLEIPSEIAAHGPTPGVLTCLACSKTFVLFDNFIAHMHEHPELQIKIETVE